MAMEVSNKLNRELLRWIQSLDLAYSIKNVKRDFSNGFLVAEIMSRYYDKDVSMHSYDNGIGIKVKKDNWEQLIKLFSRLPDLEPLANRSEIEAIIHCQNGAAVAFITKLYTCLTKRTVPLPPPVNSGSNIASLSNAPAPGAAPSSILAPKIKQEIPPYAKPTGTTLIREKMRESTIAETNDQQEIIEKVRQVHSQHEEMLQLERIFNENERHQHGTKPSVVRGSTRPVKELEASPSSSLTLSNQPIVKEVQIKSMNERNLAQLRATREAKELNMINQTAGGSSLSTVALDNRSQANEFSQKRRPFELLSELVGKKLASLGLMSAIDTRKANKFEAFLDSLDSQPSSFTDQSICSVLDIVQDEMGVVVVSFFDFPRDFWKFCGVMTPQLLRHDVESSLFRKFAAVLRSVGLEGVKRDGCAATVLLCDHLLDKLALAFVHHTTKRQALCEILYAFVPCTVLSHLQLIKRMRESAVFANDIPLFIHALAILVHLEKELDETLADLYHYYCCIGLESTCDRLRAASMSMLVPLGGFDIALVVDVLPRLTSFSLRSAWWEVKAQLLIVISFVLYQLTITPSPPAHVASHSQGLGLDEETPRDYTEQIELVLSVVEREFSSNANVVVKQIALSHLAINLAYFQELVPLFVEVLFSVPSPLLQSMVETFNTNAEDQRELPLIGVSGTRYLLPKVSTQWDPTAVAKQVWFRHANRDTASREELIVLQSCFESLTNIKRVDQIVPLYDHVKSLVTLGLLDPDSCPSTLCILRLVVDAAAGSDHLLLPLVRHESLVDVVQKLVSRNHEDTRQQQVVQFLAQQVQPTHPKVNDAFLTALKTLCDPSVYKNSLFALHFT